MFILNTNNYSNEKYFCIAEIERVTELPILPYQKFTNFGMATNSKQQVNYYSDALK